jgi:S1-C subfamily serine protease
MVVTWLRPGRLERLAPLAVGLLLAVSLAFLSPSLWRAVRPAPSPSPTPESTPPPAAVLLADEREAAEQGIVTLIVDSGAGTRFGMAFLADSSGDLLTSSDLVAGARAMRVVDNTGGSRAVRLLGTDPASGYSAVRSPTGGKPLTLGGPALEKDTPLEVLASPKNATLPASVEAGVLDPAAHRSVSPGGVEVAIHLAADLRPANVGSPVLASGARVVAMIADPGDSERLDGFAVPIGPAVADLAAWRTLPGTAMPLAPLPDTLVLRGSGDSSPPAPGLHLDRANPGRAPAGQATSVSLQGGGFKPGAALRVRFQPVGSQAGGFDGLRPSVLGEAVIVVTVPAGEPVADYSIELINGDGATTSGTARFTITP